MIRLRDITSIPIGTEWKALANFHGQIHFAPRMSCRERFRTIVAGGLLSAFLLAVGLAVAPQLHERFHQDATQPTHECAVTLIAAGKCEQANVPLQAFAPQPALQFAKLPALQSIQVPALFLHTAVFEHAPPSFA